MERKSLSPRAIFLAMGVSLAAAFAVALWIHERYAQYEPRVIAHLPEEPEAVVWMNVQYTVGFERFEDRILPFIERGRPGPEPRIKLLERKTSLELPVDTREIAMARLPGGRWLVLFGGLYRRDGVISGFVRLFEELGFATERRNRVVVVESGGEPHWLQGTGWSMADDGTLIVASDEHTARAALDQGRSSKTDYKQLLVKPGALLGAVSFPPKPPGAKGPQPERIWLSVQPGPTYPAYAEVLGASSPPGTAALLPGKDWKSAPSPEGVWAGTRELSASEVDQLVNQWLGSLAATWGGAAGAI